MSEQRGERITVIVLLPKYYNPGERGQRKKVERNKFKVTCKEITGMMMQRYGEGGCTLDLETKKGFWGQQEVIYEDDVVALEIDNFPDTKEDKQWLVQYIRDALCNRFHQEAILVKFISLVEVYVVEARRS